MSAFGAGQGLIGAMRALTLAVNRSNQQEDKAQRTGGGGQNRDPKTGQYIPLGDKRGGGGNNSLGGESATGGGGGGGDTGDAFNGDEQGNQKTRRNLLRGAQMARMFGQPLMNSSSVGTFTNTAGRALRDIGGGAATGFFTAGIPGGVVGAAVGTASFVLEGEANQSGFRAQDKLDAMIGQTNEAKRLRRQRANAMLTPESGDITGFSFTSFFTGGGGLEFQGEGGGRAEKLAQVEIDTALAKQRGDLLDVESQAIGKVQGFLTSLINEGVSADDILDEGVDTLLAVMRRRGEDQKKVMAQVTDQARKTHRNARGSGD